jgi:hypothetical protein
MGSFREKNREGIKEMQENSRETTELGSEMTEQADQINAVLESIELQDEEDVQAISETGRSYQSSFDSAFNEQVETAGQEIERQGEQIKEATGEELENVRSGISKLEQAGGISDIGRDAAEAGRSKLEGSAGEYEGIISDTEGVVDETKRQIESLKNNLSSIFG